MGAKTVRPNREPASVLDPEGGTMSTRDVKAAREVTESMMSDREVDRLAAAIADQARDGDTSLTRAARDRDRSTPRDLTSPPSPRLQADLPAPHEFRGALSARQRKLRSATKNQVMAAAPESQHRVIRSLLTAEDPQEWQRINRDLHVAAGDVQKLTDADRAKVQRLDRSIQSYERRNDRTHRVYVSVELPDNYPDVDQLQPTDVPANLQAGAELTFDQFTVTRHNLHEVPGHDSDRHLVFEIATNRGMYMGRSDSVEDTTHVLPRGMRFDVVSADFGLYDNGSRGFGGRVIIQLREKN